MFDSPVEVIGWITIALLSSKILLDAIFFFYTTFLTRFRCFQKIDLRKCGPWAGTVGLSLYHYSYMFLIINS